MFLSLEETQRLLSAVRSEGFAREFPEPAQIIDQVMIESLIWSGLQASEFCRLRVGDLHHNISHSHFRVVGKRDKRRDVVIPTSVGDLIGRYVRKIRPRYLADGSDIADPLSPLFLNERGRPFERSTLYRRVTNILVRHGIPKDRASVQLLRHTYGYLAYLLSGSNLLFVQRQLGHSHPLVTAVYAQFVKEDDQEISNRVLNKVSDFKSSK